jgi:hypothetical protein
MKSIAVAISLFLTQALLAQQPRITIEAGKSVGEVITPAISFRYKEFKPGRILLKDDVLYEAKLNYNLFNGDIMFAAPGGDTLALVKEQMLNLKLVSIDTDLYVYNKGYLQIIKENKSWSLARKQKYFEISREKMGAYNLSAPTSSIDSYNSFSDRSNLRHDLVVRENITLVLRTQYFIGDPYKFFLPATRKNFEKIFFKKRKALDSYLKEHEVDFKDEKQVTTLFLYLSEGP